MNWVCTAHSHTSASIDKNIPAVKVYRYMFPERSINMPINGAMHIVSGELKKDIADAYCANFSCGNNLCPSVAMAVHMLPDRTPC
ncbi:MAG: hypothetical protein LBK99_12850, partial [Opitutaceae bacterium]|nr:hypothetical protein [Opitutaceae bacterium]